MTQLTESQLAEIAARHEQERQWSREKHAEVSPGEPYSESGWCPMDISLADVSALLNHIAAVTAELAAANARADGERARVADELEERAIKLRHTGWTDKANELVYVAGLIRGEHEKGAEMDDDELPELVCDECLFRFTVIWSNDYDASQRVRNGQPVVEYCPRCGELLDD